MGCTIKKGPIFLLLYQTLSGKNSSKYAKLYYAPLHLLHSLRDDVYHET